MPTKLEIKSSAVPPSDFQRFLFFGGPDQGKSMIGATAPNPVWVLTEETRGDSMTREAIEYAFPLPTEEKVREWLVTNKKLTGKALEDALANFGSDDDLKEMTGITYDMPRVDLFDVKDFDSVVETLQDSPFETVIFDSASVLSRMLLDHVVACGGKNGGPMANKLQAYGKAADEVKKIFRGLYKMKKHLVFITRGKEARINLGTEKDPSFFNYLEPGFEGKDLAKNIPHDISNIFQSLTRIGKKGREFYVRTRKVTVHEWERTSSPRLDNEEPANLTHIINKILKK